jgi:hypothetical protein
MSKEIVEEIFVPGGELHLSDGGAVVWVGAQDVEGLSPDDGQVLWPVIFAGSDVVLMENDVEWPVQIVFHAPMRALDLEHAFGREALGEGAVVDVGAGLAVAQPPLGFDAPERGQTGKGWRIGGRRDHAGAAPLVPVMSAFDLRMEGGPALFVGRRESPERAGEKRAMVGLQRQGVMAPLGADLFGHARVAMQGVGGDDAAFQGHGFQRRQGRRHFVAAGRMAARQRQARL